MNNTIEQPTRKGGRPPIHHGEGSVTVRLGSSRRKLLQRHCKLNRVTMSEFLRRLIDALKDEPE